jgi:hypothetical protein
VLLSRETIGTLASVSRSQVIRCEASLVARGMLRIERTKIPSVFQYQVMRVQLPLFVLSNGSNTGSNAGTGGWSSAGLNPASVQNAVDNNEITARLAGASAGTVPTRNGDPPGCSHQVHIETEHLKKSKSKTRAEVRPHGTNISPGSFKDDEQRRSIEARNSRIETDIEQLRESSAGLSKDIYPDEWQRLVDRIAEKTKALRPMTAEEFEERRRVLAGQAARCLGAKRERT